MTMTPLEMLVTQAQAVIPRLEVTPADPDTAALGYEVRYQLPWQSQTQTGHMEEGSLMRWLDGVIAGAHSAVYWHLRQHASEPEIIATDCGTLVVTNEAGLREDLREAYFRRPEAPPRPPEAPALPEVYDLGGGMQGIGVYGQSGCPAAIVIATQSDGGYPVRVEWDTRFDETYETEVRTGARVVITLDTKISRGEWDTIALYVASLRDRPPPEEPPPYIPPDEHRDQAW